MVTRIETDNGTMAEAQPPVIDLNRADATLLDSLPGIGPKLAARIIAYRDDHGPFLFEEDIVQVDGIGPSLYEELTDRLTVTIPTSDELAHDVQPSLAATYGRFADSMAEPEDVAVLPVAKPVSEPKAFPLARETPPPLPGIQAETSEDDADWDLDLDDDDVARQPAEPETPPEKLGAIPMPGPVAKTSAPARPEPVPQQRSRAGWFWTALLGAMLGGLLGLGLSMLVFAGINGSVDVDRTVAMRRVNGQLNGLQVEMDAVKGDVGVLQGDVSGLRQRVEVLSGLTARMEQAEETLATFTKEIQTLEEETTALSSSMTQLGQDVEIMGETLDVVQAQTEKASTFFERLQQMLQEIFDDPTAEPESAAPQTEVDA